MSSDRITKVNELLRDLAAQALQSEITFKEGVIVTVAKVETSRDLRRAKVFFSVFPEAESRYAEATIRHERGALERFIHGQLFMKPLPRVLFILDTSVQNLDAVEKALLEINREDENA